MSDNEKIKIFDYLVANWAYRTYNPKGNYYNITFTISDENMNVLLNKYLKGKSIMYVGEIKDGS